MRLKWFTPDAQWTWYLAEYDPQKHIAYGFVIGLEREWGSFSVAEIEQIRGSLNLPVERDVWFTPKRASELTQI